MKTILIESKSGIELCHERVKKCIEASQPFIFPTETVYGIGCYLYDQVAIQKVYKLKSRNVNNPLSLYLSSPELVYDYCRDVPEVFKILARHFLPGPLSVILKQKLNISKYLKTSDKSVLIRIPDNNFFLNLLIKLDIPIVGTSANISGQPAVKSATDAINIFDGKIPLIIDDGITKYNKESTIISLLDNVPRILREGCITTADLKKYLINI